VKNLRITVVDKIATYQKRDGFIVCGNSDYQLVFTFDEEWDAFPEKKARFDYSGMSTDVPFTGNTCPVPTHYFKVLARTRKGNVRKAGDKLGDYKADEMQTIGFWVENKNVGTEADSWLTSVEEIERKTGFNFFPTLPKEAKQQKDKSLWF
jgi:hypothetical protein